MLVHLRALKSLYPLLRLSPWVLGTMIGLGVLTALSEGLSISLFIPLVQSQTGTESGGVMGKISELFKGIPADRRLLWIGASILICVLLKNVLSYTYVRVSHQVNASIGVRLRSGVLSQLLRVDQSYLDGQESGKLLNILATDTWRVTNAFQIFGSVIINFFITLILTILLLVISWKLTLVTGCLLLLISRIIQSLTRRAKKLSGQATESNEVLAQRMLETFEGLRLIRAFAREDHEQRRFDAASQAVGRIFLKLENLTAFVNPLSEILTTPLLIGILIVLSMGAPGQIAVSLTFLILLYRLQPRIKQFDLDRVALDALSGSVHEVGHFLDRSDKTYLLSGTRELAGIDQSIVLEGVSLRYNSGKTAALEEISCTIRVGETTALVGPSGSGKSSLISLICRFYDPTAGRLLVDGVPLPELDLKWWRDQIAVVSQDLYLFNTTVAENILYGNLDASREEMIEAARRAHALEFIESLPNKFETILGDGGIRLSGGQRQRLALARAFIRDPEILILDEATNSLDLISEGVVQDALQQFGKSRTVLIIAHRISTIEHADKVIVLEAGKIIETGPVAQLLAAGGLFSRFYAMQFQKQHLEATVPRSHALPA